MGMPRTCPNCFANDGFYISFVEDAHEIEHHKEKWCKCGYDSPEEMIKELRKKYRFEFEDPKWVYFAREYLSRRKYKLNFKHDVTLDLVGEFLHDLFWASNHSSSNISLISKNLSEKIESNEDKKQLSQIKNKLPDWESEIPQDLSDSILASSKMTTKKSDSNKHIKKNNHRMKYLIKVSKYKVLLSFIIGLILLLYVSINSAKTNYYLIGESDPVNKSYCVYKGKLDSRCVTKSVNNYPKGALYGLIIGTSFFFLISFQKKPNNR